MTEKVKEFLIYMVKCLKKEGLINPVELIAPLAKQLCTPQYQKLLGHIISSESYQFTYNNSSGGYTNGTLNICFNFKTTKSKSYILDFMIDKRLNKYCDCKETDPDYVQAHHCCGNDCDFFVPQVAVTFVQDVGIVNWNGTQKDLWKYTDELKKKIDNDEEINRLKYEIAQKQRQLAKMIA